MVGLTNYWLQGQEGLEQSERRTEMERLQHDLDVYGYVAAEERRISDNRYWPSFSTAYATEGTAVQNAEMYIDEKGNARLRKKRRRIKKIHLGNGTPLYES